MLTIKERVIQSKCENDGLFFNRYFYKQANGTKMLISGHHLAIRDALQRVINGEITRLIINIPPGYGKTMIATINMMARSSQ